MAQLPYRPLKHRALQLGADHYFESTGSTLRDAIAQKDLVATGAPANAADLGGSARTWVDADLKLPAGAFIAPGSLVLPEKFSFFGRFGVAGPAAIGTRNMLSLDFSNGDTLDLVLSKDRANVKGSVMWYWNSVSGGLGGGYASLTIPDGAAEQYVYAAVFTRAGKTYVMLAMAGYKPNIDELMVVSGGGTPVTHRPAGAVTVRSIGGMGAITGTDTYSGRDSRMRYSDFTLRASSLFTAPSDSSPGQMMSLARQLEVGSYSASEVLPPQDNAEGLLGQAITETDTLVSLNGDPLAFVAPGPNEEGRVTIVDPADRAVFEVCALIGNYGGQLELIRGVDGTTARPWAAGALILGLLNNAHFRPGAGENEGLPELIATAKPVTLGTATALSVDASEVIGANAYAEKVTSSTVMGASAYGTDLESSVVIGASAYGAKVTRSTIMGASAHGTNLFYATVIGPGAYAENMGATVVIGRNSYASSTDNSVAIGNGATVETVNNSVALGANSYVTLSQGGVALGYGTYLDNSASAAVVGDSSRLDTCPDTVLLGRGRTAHSLPGVLVAPGPAVLPNYSAAGDLSASLPAHAKRATYESAIFSAPGMSLEAQTISFVLPAGVRVLLDEIGFVMDGAPTGSLDGMIVSVKNESGEYLVQSAPLSGALEAFRRWRTSSFLKDAAASVVDLVIEAAPASATGTLQAYLKGLFVQTQ